VSKYIFLSSLLWVLREMADFKSRARKVKDKSRISCYEGKKRYDHRNIGRSHQPKSYRSSHWPKYAII
jgi:hypothetical protein